MLVFCGRRHGLFANLTRFVYFRPPSRAEQQATADVAAVEARALALSRPGTALARIYEGLVSAYAARGQLGAERFHHQGGTCGYGSRDEVARPGLTSVIPSRGAVAWNPSLPGAKIEDTVLVSTGADEVLTVDPHWPAAMLEGRLRPEPWVR